MRLTPLCLSLGLALALPACSRPVGLGLRDARFGIGFPEAKAEGAGAILPTPGASGVGEAPTAPGDGPKLPQGPAASLNANAMVVATVAGRPGESGLMDGLSSVARFFNPYGIGFGDESEPVAFVADTFNHAIRVVTSSGETRTLAGNGLPGHADGQGQAASFRGPRGLAYHPGTRTLWVADTENQCIRTVGLDGTVRTVAGHPSRTGHANGPGATVASFDSPCGVVVAPGGTCYVADTVGCAIRAIAPDGSVRLVAGSDSGADGYLDGVGTAVRFTFPRALALGSDGLLYVADTNNHRIRRVHPNGSVSTIAGSAAGFQDGPGATARFQFPHGIAADAAGRLYVSDTFNHAVRRIRPTEPGSPVDTLAGTGGQGTGDGNAATATFFEPAGMALAPDGSLWVLDTRNHSIRRLTPQ